MCTECAYSFLSLSVRPTAGWKLSPMMGAMYGPELYAGNAISSPSSSLTLKYCLNSLFYILVTFPIFNSY